MRRGRICVRLFHARIETKGKAMKKLIRNIGIMAHVDAGKTTLTERILFAAGRLHKMGEVHKGTAEMDWRRLEKKHGITISAAATSCAWNGCTLTIIDTPGHADFTLEVERSLRILDSAIALFSAVSGVEPQSETVWRQADRFGVPRLCFINKMDQAGADFPRTVSEIGSRLGAVPLVLQLPLGGQAQFCGVIDLVAMQALIWNSQTAPPVTGGVLEAFREEAGRWRRQLVEQLAESDDAAMAAWLKDESGLDAAEIKALIRKGTIAGRFSPVLCGSAYHNIGVEPLLDAVADYCPSPLDRPAVTGTDPRTGEAVTRAAHDAEPPTAIVSKVQTGRFGTLAFVRLYAGSMRTGMRLRNTRVGETRRIGRILRMHADEAAEIAEARAGDIVAVTGLKLVSAGDTLCAPGHPVALSGFECPEPVISAVIEPRSAADRQRFGEALSAICQEDPSLRVTADAETGQTLLHGMGELHLTICVETLKDEHNVEASLHAPQVAFREAITRRAVTDYTLRKQTGGPGLYARVKLAFEPLAEGESGLVFEDRTSGGIIPAAFVPGIEKGLRTALQEGGLARFPVTGVRATLLDGGHHARDSSLFAFELAAQAAFKQAYQEAGPMLLEPLMEAGIGTPSDYLGAIIGDLKARRGAVLKTGMRGAWHEIAAQVPLANMFGYVSRLRSLSQGRARFTMRFACYAPVPGRQMQDIIAAAS
jgi:elongation factor G